MAILKTNGLGEARVFLCFSDDRCHEVVEVNDATFFLGSLVLFEDFSETSRAEWNLEACLCQFFRSLRWCDHMSVCPVNCREYVVDTTRFCVVSHTRRHE